jgi:mannose-6-phosphate isomerase-like protein (cupin superfamily)
MKQLAKFNLDRLLEPHPPRTNFNVMHIDGGYSVRVAKITGRFPWHHHPHGDEGWLVYRGRVRIETESGAVTLGAGEGTVVPKGLKHSPVAEEEGTIVVIFNLRELGMTLTEGEHTPPEFKIVEMED